MVQPTIYKPSVYNGNGIYKNGAASGGVVQITPFYNNFIMTAGTPDSIILDNAESNKDLSIKVNFVKVNTNDRTILELFAEDNTRVSRVRVSTSMYVANNDSTGDNTAWNTDRNPNVVIIRNSSYAVYYGGSNSNWSCGYTENNFKKIAFSAGVIYQKISLYKSSSLTGEPTEYLHNFIPYYENVSDLGLIDTITGVKYPYIANTKVY